MVSVHGALLAQKTRNLKGWRHWRVPRALKLVGLAVHGCLPVGGSGDTGMFKAGYTGQSAGRESPFQKNSNNNRNNSHADSMWRREFWARGSVGFFCVFTLL